MPTREREGPLRKPQEEEGQQRCLQEPRCGSRCCSRARSPCPAPPARLSPLSTSRQRNGPAGSGGERKRWDNQLGKYLLLRRESCQKQSPARQRYLCRQLPSLPAGSERLHVQHEPKRGERDRAQGCQRVCVFPYSRSLLCSF